MPNYVMLPLALVSMASLALERGFSADRVANPIANPMLQKSQKSADSFFQCTPMLAATHTRVTYGEKIDFKLTFTFTAWGAETFNPFFDENQPSPAWLSVFSSNGEHIVNIVAPQVAREFPDRKTFILLRSGDVAGRSFRVSVIAPDRRSTASGNDHTPGNKSPGYKLALRPGRYLVQGIYTRALLASTWNTRNNDSNDRLGLAAELLCASNVVEIEIYDTSTQHSEETAAHKQNPQSASVSVGSVSLALDRKAAIVGSTLLADLRFTNSTAQWLEIYDPFLASVQGMGLAACELRLFDSRGNYYGDLFSSLSGNSGIVPHMWVTIPPDGICGRRFEFRAGYSAESLFNSDLPLGRYAIQAVYLDRFISWCPFVGVEDLGESSSTPKLRVTLENSERLKDWKARYPGNKLIETNKVEFDIASSSQGSQ